MLPPLLLCFLIISLFVFHTEFKSLFLFPCINANCILIRITENLLYCSYFNNIQYLKKMLLLIYFCFYLVSYSFTSVCILSPILSYLPVFFFDAVVNCFCWLLLPFLPVLLAPFSCKVRWFIWDISLNSLLLYAGL